MNNWQDWAVALLLILCIVRIALYIRSFIIRTKETKNPCSSCSSNCELKRQFDQKKAECKGAKAATAHKESATKAKQHPIKPAP